MPTASGEQFLTVVFIDICNSTRLFEEYGNANALAMTSECIDGLKTIIAQNEGTVIQTQGDGIFCTFPTTDTGFRAVRRMAEQQKNKPLSIHAGLHHGPVIVQAASVYGDTVNVASRMADLADDEEIILSEDAWNHLSPHLRINTRSLGKVPVKGKTAPVEIYLVMLGEDGSTDFMRRFDMPAATTITTLELFYQNRSIELTDMSSNFVIGRSHDCDLVVDHSHVSRRHATIECKRGKFFLSDHSSNGTFVVAEKQKITALKRDFMQLFGEGAMSFGSKPGKNQENQVHFKISDT